MATSALVLDAVSDELSESGVTLTTSELRRQITVTIPQNTVVLDVTASSADKDLAAEIVNSVAENLTATVYDIAPKDALQESTVEARIIEPGVPAKFQSSPNKSQDAVLGVLSGGLLATLGLTAWTLLDRRVRSMAVLHAVADLPVLGSVPRRKGKGKSEGPVFETTPNGAIAEAFRQVRSALKFSAVERQINVLAVTSSIAGEGKSTTSVNLALAFAETGQRVLLVDADLRRPTIADILQLENAVGLSTALVERVTVEDAVFTTAQGIDVLTAGEQAPNPAQLLASRKMQELVHALSEYYDLVIIDTAPVLSVADATIISQYADSMLVVVNARATTKSQLTRSVAALQGVGAELAGFVLNNVREDKKDKYLYSPDS